MAGVESSSNVYVQGIDDGKITVIDLPIISSTDIQGYYLVGEERQFSVSTENLTTGGVFSHVKFLFEVTANAGDITSLKYDAGGGTFLDLPLTCSGGVCSGEFGPGLGFPMPAPYSATTAFKVTFATAKNYPVTIKLIDLDSSPSGYELARYEKTANVYTPPTLNSTDIQGYYLSGEQREFSVVLTNPLTGGNFAHVYVNYMIANADMDQIQSIEYSVDHITWVTLGAEGSGTSYGEDGSGNIVGYFGQITGGGFPMAPDSTQTTWFRVTFKTREQGTTDYPTSYDISMKLMDADFTPADRQLTDFSKTANVYDKPTIASDDIVGPYLAGVSQEFHVTTTNPATGGSFATVLFRYRITGAVLADIYQFQYKAGDQWLDMPLTQDGLDLVGYFGPSSGFPMGPSYTATTTFRITFKTPKDYPFTLTLNDLGMANRELVKFEETAEVESGFAITGTFTMQGNLNRGGIPVTLTWTGTGWEYSESETTEDLMANNFQVTVTYGGGYRITTNQPRYLNLTTASNKTITVDAAKTLAALMLRGGNVVNADTSLDIIDLSDAGLIGGVYGSSGDPSLTPADANFDGRVNILDLALVGGNYLMESATAYNGWVPLP